MKNRISSFYMPYVILLFALMEEERKKKKKKKKKLTDTSLRLLIYPGV